MSEPLPNPYVGPRPFERTDEARFFARDAEVQELRSLVVAERVVLLYAASGAGKSSLLNAGLVPLLEREEGFEVLPAARIQGALDDESVRLASNVYMLGVLATLQADEHDEERTLSPLQTLTGFLAERPRMLTDDGFDAPRAVVFDQFEELFTLYPTLWTQREAFFGQLRQALDDDPLLRVVLALREDFIAQLDSYAPLLPGGLRTRLRLERLGRDQALSAVLDPAGATARQYAPRVAEKLVADLLRFHVEVEGEAVEAVGEFVEPVQLQVVCQSLWSELPPEVREIDEHHLQAFGDVDEVLMRFYDGVIAAAAAAGPLDEVRLRRWVEDALITSVGTRGTVHLSDEPSADIPTTAIVELENRHLIRAEYRAGARWYELTHDRLITPIRKANARFVSGLQLPGVRSPSLGALEALVESVPLSELQRRFLSARWVDNVRWLEVAAERAHRRYYALSLTTLVGAALLPALLSLSAGVGIKPAFTWVAFAVSLVVLMSAAAERFFRFEDRWRHYRETAEALKAEGWMFLELAGRYSSFRTHTEAFPAFARAVEQPMADEANRYVTRVKEETPAAWPKP